MYYVKGVYKRKALIVDTSDGVEEWLDRAQLIELVRLGISVNGISRGNNVQNNDFIIQLRDGYSVAACPHVFTPYEAKLGLMYGIRCKHNVWNQLTAIVFEGGIPKTGSMDLSKLASSVFFNFSLFEFPVSMEVNDFIIKTGSLKAFQHSTEVDQACFGIMNIDVSGSSFSVVRKVLSYYGQMYNGKNLTGEGRLPELILIWDVMTIPDRTLPDLYKRHPFEEDFELNFLFLKMFKSRILAAERYDGKEISFRSDQITLLQQLRGCSYEELQKHVRFTTKSTIYDLFVKFNRFSVDGKYTNTGCSLLSLILKFFVLGGDDLELYKVLMDYI